MSQIKRLHTKAGMFVVLVTRSGRKWTKVINIDAGGLRLSRVPNADIDEMEDLLYKGKPYPIKRAVAHFRRMAKQYGATKGVKQELRVAV